MTQPKRIPNELVVKGALELFNEMIANLTPEKQLEARLEFDAILEAELESRKQESHTSHN